MERKGFMMILDLLRAGWITGFQYLEIIDYAVILHTTSLSLIVA